MSAKGFSLDPQTIPTIKTKYRSIQTAIPVPESIPLFEKLAEVETQAMHGQFPIIWDSAKDFQIHDKWGNTWIDFTSTIFVANTGHANPRITKALAQQIEKPLLHTYNYVHEARVDYLSYLIQNTPKQFEKAFLLSAGTEAVEAALKLMRLNGQRQNPNKLGVISFEGNWHGRTMGAQFLGGNEEQKEWIGHSDPHIYHIPFPYPWSEGISDPEALFETYLNNLLESKNINPDNDLCGFMIETFQGWGAWFYPKPFIKALEKFAKKHNILICFDEMQAGFGRTGELFGYMHYGIEPDLICLGKGASSSLPLSVVLGPKEILDLPSIGSMSSTHSANPLSCAAGLANLQALLEDGILENAKRLGNIFHARLEEIKSKYSDVISDVCGHGLLAALIFMDKNRTPLSKFATNVSTKCLYKGLLTVHTGRESIKFAPPLSISEEALLEGLDVLEEAINETHTKMSNTI